MLIKVGIRHCLVGVVGYHVCLTHLLIEFAQGRRFEPGMRHRFCESSSHHSFAMARCRSRWELGSFALQVTDKNLQHKHRSVTLFVSAYGCCRHIIETGRVFYGTFLFSNTFSFMNEFQFVGWQLVFVRGIGSPSPHIHIHSSSSYSSPLDTIATICTSLSDQVCFSYSFHCSSLA